MRSDGTVEVYQGGCMSSSCDRNEVASCTATLDGTTITVTSSFSWETATSGVDCTDDCGFLIAECDLASALDDGVYTLVHGSETTTISLPDDGGDCEDF